MMPTQFKSWSIEAALFSSTIKTNATEQFLNGSVSSNAGFVASISLAVQTAGVHYRSIPDLKIYREQFGWRADEWPNAKHIGDRTLSLPLSAKLSDEDVEDVVTAVRATLGR